MTNGGVVHGHGGLQNAFMSAEILKLVSLSKSYMKKDRVKPLDFCYFTSLYARLAKLSSFYGGKIA